MFRPGWDGIGSFTHFSTNILSLKGLFILIFKSGIGILKSGKAEIFNFSGHSKLIEGR